MRAFLIVILVVVVRGRILVRETFSNDACTEQNEFSGGSLMLVNLDLCDKCSQWDDRPDGVIFQRYNERAGTVEMCTYDVRKERPNDAGMGCSSKLECTTLTLGDCTPSPCPLYTHIQGTPVVQYYHRVTLVEDESSFVALTTRCRANDCELRGYDYTLLYEVDDVCKPRASGYFDDYVTVGVPPGEYCAPIKVNTSGSDVTVCENTPCPSVGCSGPYTDQTTRCSEVQCPVCHAPEPICTCEKHPGVQVPIHALTPSIQPRKWVRPPSLDGTRSSGATALAAAVSTLSIALFFIF